MKLSSLLNKNLIFLDYNFINYTEIMDFVSSKLSQQSSIPANIVREALEKRENLGTTFIGHRLALPHGYVENIDEIIVLFIRLSKEISVYVDHHPHAVKYVFAIITSKKKAQLYLKVLSAIAQLVTNNVYILDGTTSGRELIDTLDQKEIMVDENLTAKDIISCKASIMRDETVARAVDVMNINKLTFLPVVDDWGKLTGVIDIVDLFRAVFPQMTAESGSFELLTEMGAAGGTLIEPIKLFWEHEDHNHVRDVMRSTETYTINESASYVEIVQLMIAHHHRYLIVIDNVQKVKGIIDTGDVIHKMIRA